MNDIAAMMEGPRHKGHGLQVQVGWLGMNSGTLYPWGTDEKDIRANEPGSYTPIYIDLGD